jgi:hypothetical protein
LRAGSSEHLGGRKAHVIAYQPTTQSPAKTPSADGVRVSGEIMLCRAMSPHPGQFLPLKKES